MTFMQVDIRLDYVLDNDLDLYFQEQTFQEAILTNKCWKNANITFFCHQILSIYHRMVPLRMLYVLTLTYIFTVTNFEI